MERPTNQESGSRDAESERDRESRPLYDRKSNRGDDGGYAYGGYPEAGFGPRETRRHGDHGRSGRERTERGHYSADRPRDYAENDWNRAYGARRYWDDDQQYGDRDDQDHYRGSRDRGQDWRGREGRQSTLDYMGYADPYGWPTYIPYAAGDFGRSTYDRGRHRPRDRHDRGFLERAGDEVLSWFGDEEAQRRRDRDHRGRGPADYVRSDDRIREDVNDRLTEDYWVDASRIGVTVSGGEVTLDGTVDGKRAKRRAEDLADDVTGVKHVQNNLRIDSASFAPQGS